MRLASLVFVSSITWISAFASASCSSSDTSSSSSSTSSSGDSGTSGSSGSSGTSGSSGSSGCVDYSPPAGFNATTPTVSFATDVMPIFGQSCAFSVCHGSATGTNNGLFLGQGDAATVYSGLVGKVGNENPTMPFVTAGDARNSYLMRKMDGSQCAIDAQCTGGSCQDSMPQGLGTLDVATRDTVRRWISQGAKND